MKVQKTNYSSLVEFIINSFSQSFVGPWKFRSISLIAILSGYYIASSISSYFLAITNQRIFICFILLLIYEFSVRSRNFIINRKLSIMLLIIDNLRIGITYSIVLEAFKLGS